jgi:chaperone required for assembly of F1-ATPase
MTQRGTAKFYKTVAVAPEGDSYAIRLDGKPLKTPARATLLLPTRALADAIAREWGEAGERLDPSFMPLTRLAFAATDAVTSHRARLADDILAFGRSDLLCYRAESPDALVARQAAAWDPLLAWVRDTLGAELETGAGIVFVSQPEDALAILRREVDSFDHFALAALHGAASITGSLVLAMALARERLTSAETFDLSRIDETFQAEAWGRDAEAEARAARLARELEAIDRFLRMLRA